MKRALSTFMLVLLLVSTLTLAFNTQNVRASGTIYIRATGLVEGTDKIQRDGDVYTFTDDINDSIVVQKSNIVIDGNGYMVWGSRHGLGFSLTNVRNITIEKVHIENFWVGIDLDHSLNVAISGTNITNNHYGICLYFSSSNTLSGNNITANNFHGIWLDFSWGNTISGNTFTNDGLYVHYSYQNSVENNTVNGRPLVYLEGVSNHTVDDAGQVILVRCENIRVEGLNLSRTDVGVQLWETSNSTISGNNITNNYGGVYLISSGNNTVSGNNIKNNNYGIWLDFASSGNTISGNNITNNGAGIMLYSSSNYSVFHNNFINNTSQVYSSDSMNVWDDGYPSGGNYWSDYTGVDLYSGPYQNETDSDSMGDTPYVIDGSNQDNYPLMGPWTTAGENASVTLPNDVSLVFANVTSGGITTINVTTFEPDRPMGFILAAEPYVYYNIDTTAGYSGNVTVSVPYNDVNMTLEEENDLKLMHWEETLQAWVNVTTLVDVTNNIIYGQTSSLSPFAIMIQTIPGDVNGDYYVNAKDAVILGGAFYPAGTYETNADINDDGYCNAKDAIILGTYFGQHWP